ncbi:MAG: hypothetical protein RLZZ241_453 [Bacteroidota bacterium]|jgi:galactose mutarotase-like enzyme
MIDPALDTFELHQGMLRARVTSGQLTGLRLGETEFMHTADQPGWSNSDTEMFPVIGPTLQQNYRIEVPRGTAVLDQHGFLRDMPYAMESCTESELMLVKRYSANTPVRNGKFPQRSTEESLTWPYSFTFRKQFSLYPNHLEITFSISGDSGMPFMLGYHPAFRIHSAKARVLGCNTTVNFEDIIAVGDRALPVPRCERITLEDYHSLHIETSGFSHFMLWTPHPEMLCIEPITYYPYVEGGTLQDGFSKLSDVTTAFKVRLFPEV